MRSNSKDLNCAKKACFHLLKVRPRSEYELRSRLKLKGFDQKVIEQVIIFLRGLGFIDDTSFARLWVQSRINRPLGLNRLYFELKQKGIEKKTIEQVLNEYKSPEKEEAIIRDLLARKLKRMQNQNIDKQKIKNRLWGFFLRKGFSKDIVLDVLSEL